MYCIFYPADMLDRPSITANCETDRIFYIDKQEYWDATELWISTDNEGRRTLAVNIGEHTNM